MGKSYKKDMQKIRQKERSKKVLKEELQNVDKSYYGKKQDDTTPKTWLEVTYTRRKPQIDIVKAKQIGTKAQCLKCGHPVYKDNYCWECYKEQKSQ